jgi:hypothetical protein
VVNAAISSADVDVFTAVFERLPHGISVVRLEDENDLGSFRFIEATPTASRHSGVDLSYLIGTTMRESFPEVLETDWPQKYLKAIRTGEPVLIGDIEYPDRTMSEGHFTITAVPLGGQYLAILFANTSKRHRLERELVEKTKETARLAMLHKTALAMAHHIRNALTSFGPTCRVLRWERPGDRQSVEKDGYRAGRPDRGYYRRSRRDITTKQ